MPTPVANPPRAVIPYRQAARHDWPAAQTGQPARMGSGRHIGVPMGRKLFEAVWASVAVILYIVARRGDWSGSSHVSPSWAPAAFVLVGGSFAVYQAVRALLKWKFGRARG